MKTEQYIPTEEDIRNAEEGQTPEQKIRSEAYQAGFIIGKEKNIQTEEKVSGQLSSEDFADYQKAKDEGRMAGSPRYGRFEKFTGLTPITYLYQRTGGTYEVHINKDVYIEGRIEGEGLKEMFDIDPNKTAAQYISKVPAIIKLDGDGKFTVITRGEVKQIG